MKLYVGNLPYTFEAEDLKKLFAKFGNVVNATIIQDRETKQSRGFGFVEMSSREEGEAAIAALDKQNNGGRALIVNEAKPQGDRGDRNGGGRDFGDRSRDRDSERRGPPRSKKF